MESRQYQHRHQIKEPLEDEDADRVLGGNARR